MQTEKIELTVNTSPSPLEQINRPTVPLGAAALTKPNLLDRTHFKISRSAEYFDVKELVAQTGQPNTKFGEVVLKELIDNALDACEGAGVETTIHIGIATDHDKLRIAISDNGAGISENVIASILDFDTRTSDKAAYKAPTRGAQGNAFKTIIGIPHALGGGMVIVESKGLRHEITATATPAGTIEINRRVSRIINKVGTTVYVDLPWLECRADWYARAAALFNPHANVKITFFDDMQFSILTLNCAFSESTISYNRLTECKKIRSNEPTSAHWYDPNDFSKLVYLQALQNDMGIGQFVRQFRGLASTGKAKEITNGLPFKLVSDIHTDDSVIAILHKAKLDRAALVQTGIWHDPQHTLCI